MKSSPQGQRWTKREVRVWRRSPRSMSKPRRSQVSSGKDYRRFFFLSVSRAFALSLELHVKRKASPVCCFLSRSLSLCQLLNSPPVASTGHGKPFLFDSVVFFPPPPHPPTDRLYCSSLKRARLPTAVSFMCSQCSSSSSNESGTSSCSGEAAVAVTAELVRTLFWTSGRTTTGSSAVRGGAI